ncbi:hypothetical protein KC329_g67 [Hortaea werneckii]|nr:hypothetical protein KC329_g67 [Hortaea werneckii]
MGALQATASCLSRAMDAMWKHHHGMCPGRGYYGDSRGYSDPHERGMRVERYGQWSPVGGESEPKCEEASKPMGGHSAKPSGALGVESPQASRVLAWRRRWISASAPACSGGEKGHRVLYASTAILGALPHVSLRHDAECVACFIDRLQPSPTFSRLYDSESVLALKKLVHGCSAPHQERPHRAHSCYAIHARQPSNARHDGPDSRACLPCCRRAPSMHSSVAGADNHRPHPIARVPGRGHENIHALDHQKHPRAPPCLPLRRTLGVGTIRRRIHPAGQHRPPVSVCDHEIETPSGVGLDFPPVLPHTAGLGGSTSPGEIVESGLEIDALPAEQTF